MQQVKEVDLMNNKKLILWLNLSVIPLFFIFFFIFKLCVSSDGQLDEFTIGLLDPFLLTVNTIFLPFSCITTNPFILLVFILPLDTHPVNQGMGIIE